MMIIKIIKIYNLEIIASVVKRARFDQHADLLQLLQNIVLVLKQGIQGIRKIEHFAGGRLLMELWERREGRENVCVCVCV